MLLCHDDESYKISGNGHAMKLDPNTLASDPSWRCYINRLRGVNLQKRHDANRIHAQEWQMPYKNTEGHQHEFAKPKYKVVDWPKYNDALLRCGDFTIWFTEAAINEWRPAKTGARGRPQEYSNHAIETAVLICQAFHLPLRQTEGFMNSMTRLMNFATCIPNFSSISRRRVDLPRHTLRKALHPGSLVLVDFTGLKVYGKDEWHQERHDLPARRTWRKLHLAVDENHEISACELTTPEVGDPTAVPDLLDRLRHGSVRLR